MIDSGIVRAQLSQSSWNFVEPKVDHFQQILLAVHAMISVSCVLALHRDRSGPVETLTAKRAICAQ